MYITIIGTNHEHQYCRLGKNSLNFVRLLKSVLTNSQFDLVAEELNKDSIDQENALGSVAKNVADELAIFHLFVDPGVIERKGLGIVGFKQIVKEVCGGSVVKPELREEVERRHKAEWTSPALVDKSLSCKFKFSHFARRSIPQSRMDTLPVVKLFNIGKDTLPCLGSISIIMVEDMLFL